MKHRGTANARLDGPRARNPNLATSTRDGGRPWDACRPRAGFPDAGRTSPASRPNARPPQSCPSGNPRQLPRPDGRLPLRQELHKLATAATSRSAGADEEEPRSLSPSFLESGCCGLVTIGASYTSLIGHLKLLLFGAAGATYDRSFASNARAADSIARSYSPCGCGSRRHRHPRLQLRQRANTDVALRPGAGRSAVGLPHPAKSDSPARESPVSSQAAAS